MPGVLSISTFERLAKLACVLESPLARQTVEQDLEIFLSEEAMLENVRRAMRKVVALARKEFWQKSAAASVMGGLVMIHAGSAPD